MTLQNIGFIKLFVILKLYMIHKHQQQRTPHTSTTTIVTRMRIYQVPTPQQHHLPVCLSLQEARTNCSQPRSTTNNDITKCFPKQIIRNIEALYDSQTSTPTYTTSINHNDHHTHSPSTRYHKHLCNASYRFVE